VRVEKGARAPERKSMRDHVKGNIWLAIFYVMIVLMALNIVGVILLLRVAMGC
jgi:hypothetical protein